MYKTNFYFQKKSAFSYAVFRNKVWSRILVGQNGGFASIGGSKRIGASSFVIDDIAYVVGGENNSDVVTDFWAFDPSSGTWTEKREISNVSDEDYDDDYSTIPRSYGVAFAMYGLGQAFREEDRHVCIVENTIRQFSCRKCGRDNGVYAIVPPMIS